MTIPEQLANRDLSDDVLRPVTELARPAPASSSSAAASSAPRSRTTSRAPARPTSSCWSAARLTNGTTWHAAGLVSQVRGHPARSPSSRAYNAETYERLPAETGIETGLRRVGALTVARTEGRMQEILLRRRHGARRRRRRRGPRPPAQVKDLWPGAVVDDLVGAVLFPTDGTVNPGDAALSFAKGAVDAGVRVRAGDRGDGLPRSTGGRVTGVRDLARGRSRRRPSCSRAGLWTSELARRAGASVAAVSGRARLGDDGGGRGRRRAHARSCATSTATCTSATTAGATSSARSSRRASRSRSARSRPAGSRSSARTGTTSRRCWPTPGSACPSSRRSASRTTCARRRASRRTRTSSSGTCRRCPACSSRPASTRRASSSAPAPAARPPSGSWPATPRWTSPRSTSRGWAGGRRSARGCTSARSSRSAACTRCTGPASSR